MRTMCRRFRLALFSIAIMSFGVVAWVISGWIHLKCTYRANSPGLLIYHIQIAYGCIHIGSYADSTGQSGWPGLPSGLNIERALWAPQWRVECDLIWQSGPRYLLQTRAVDIPIIVLLLLYAVGWLVVRRFATGHVKPSCCKCGYSVAGVSGNSRCPECGHLMSPTRA
jgi:hypothetical protein